MKLIKLVFMKNQCMTLMSELLQLWSAYEQTADSNIMNIIQEKEKQLERYYVYVSYHDCFGPMIQPLYTSYIAIRTFKINMLKEKH